MASRKRRLTIVAELPRIHATTPLPCKNLDRQGVHRAPVKFSTVSATKLSPIQAFKFLNGEASKFSYIKRGYV